MNVCGDQLETPCCGFSRRLLDLVQSVSILHDRSNSIGSKSPLSHITNPETFAAAVYARPGLRFIQEASISVLSTDRKGRTKILVISLRAPYLPYHPSHHRNPLPPTTLPPSRPPPSASSTPSPRDPPPPASPPPPPTKTSPPSSPHSRSAAHHRKTPSPRTTPRCSSAASPCDSSCPPGKSPRGGRNRGRAAARRARVRVS